MTLKKFRLVCKGTSFILQLIAVFCCVILLTGVVMVFILQSSGSSFVFEPTFTSPVFASLGSFTDDRLELAAQYIVPPFLFFFSYVFYKGSQLFTQLAEGQTPFRYDFAEDLKRIAVLLILFDVLSPLIYSAVLSVIIENGYYFTFGLSSTFLMGLILYVMSEVLKYGIQLQQLANDTI